MRKKPTISLLFSCIVILALNACSMIQYAKGENEDVKFQIETSKKVLIKSNVNGIVRQKLHKHGYYLLIENETALSQMAYYDLYTIDSTAIKIKVSRKLFTHAEVNDSINTNGNTLCLLTSHLKLNLLSEEYGKWYP